MSLELNWEKEIEYRFSHRGFDFKEELYSNGIDGKLYRMYEEELSSLTPTTRQSEVWLNPPTVIEPVYADLKVVDAVMLAEKLITDSKYMKTYHVLYWLPDVHKTFLVQVSEDFEWTYEEYEEDGELKSRDIFLGSYKGWGFVPVVY